MKPRCSNQRNRALTKIEVVVFIAVIAAVFFFAILQVLLAANKGAKGIKCVNNLKQMGVAHQLWVDDTDNQFPLLASSEDNDARKSTRNDSAYILWQAMSNQLGTPQILICPADRKRTIATSFAIGFGNANISYFLNAAAKIDPQMVLDGDANLTVDGVPVQSGILNLWTNSRVGWTKERNHGTASRGFIGMADGSVAGTTSNSLNLAFAASPATNRLAIP